MSDEAKPRLFGAMEAGARQVILMAGLGFFGLFAGAFLTSTLISRINDRIGDGDNVVVQVALAIILPNLWALFVIPGLGYLTLRFLDMKASSFALVSCSTAFIVRLMLRYVSGGSEAFDDPRALIFEVGLFVVAVTLTYIAGRRGAVHARAQAALAAEQAKKAKDQYSQFAEQAKALAEKREAQPIAPAAAPETAAPAAPEAPPADPTKT
jgi:hypothetical protein